MNLPPRRVKGVGLNLGEQNLHHADNWLTTAAPREPKVIDKLAKPRGHPGSPTHSFLISTTSGHPLILGPAEPPASGRFFGEDWPSRQSLRVALPQRWMQPRLLTRYEALVG